MQMFVRPINCHDCGNGFHALGHVVDYAQQQGVIVTDIAGENANKDYVFSAIDSNNPTSFYGFGHGGSCYSEDTEILTEDGWKYFYDLKSEKVATLNPETNELEYKIPTQYFSYLYTGKMFYQKGRSIDLLVTPNHKLWVSWLCSEGKDYKPYQFIMPKDLKNGRKQDEKTGRFLSTNITNSRLKFKRDAIWQGKEKKYFILPQITKKIKNQYGCESEYSVEEKKILMDNWLEFFGYWLSEGSACLGFADKNKKYINYRVSITQNNDSNRNKIKKNIEKLGYTYQETGNGHSMNLEIRNKQLYSYLKQFGHAHDKFIPKEIKQLSKRQLKFLFDALILGDGSDHITSFTYFSSSKRLAEDMMEISLKIGYAATLSRNYKGIYHVNIATGANMNPLSHKRNRGFIEYKGMIYCVEVPNHIVYVRRNGKPVWCGNSRFTGDSEQDIFTVNECDKLAGKEVYLLSCLTANSLGPAIIQNGANAYAGYRISWTWVSDSGSDGDPYQDLYAKGFYESANELWLALIDGATFEEAVQAAIDRYNWWIDYWFNENPEAPQSQDAIMWLIHDRNGLVALYPGMEMEIKVNWPLIAIGGALALGIIYFAMKKPAPILKRA